MLFLIFFFFVVSVLQMSSLSIKSGEDWNSVALSSWKDNVQPKQELLKLKHDLQVCLLDHTAVKKNFFFVTLVFIYLLCLFSPSFLFLNSCWLTFIRVIADSAGGQGVHLRRHRGRCRVSIRRSLIPCRPFVLQSHQRLRKTCCKYSVDFSNICCYIT